MKKLPYKFTEVFSLKYSLLEIPFPGVGFDNIQGRPRIDCDLLNFTQSGQYSHNICPRIPKVDSCLIQ